MSNRFQTKSKMNQNNIQKISDFLQNTETSFTDLQRFQKYISDTSFEKIIFKIFQKNGFSDKQILSQIKSMRIVNFPANCLIFQTHDVDEIVYFVLNGKISLFLQSPSIYIMPVNEDESKVIPESEKKELKTPNRIEKSVQFKKQDGKEIEYHENEFLENKRVSNRNQSSHFERVSDFLKKKSVIVSHQKTSNWFQIKHDDDSSKNNGFFIQKKQQSNNKNTSIIRNSARISQFQNATPLKLALQEQMHRNRINKYLDFVFIAVKIKSKFHKLISKIRHKNSHLFNLQIVKKDGLFFVNNLKQAQRSFAKEFSDDSYFFNFKLLSCNSSDYAGITTQETSVLIVENKAIFNLFLKEEKINREKVSIFLEKSLNLNFDSIQKQIIFRLLNENVVFLLENHSFQR